MKHTVSTYQDLIFLIPKDWNTGDPKPKKFIVFFNNKHKAENAALFLRSCLSQELHHHIKWFYASMLMFYWSEEMELFKVGVRWGFQLMDVGGMVSGAYQM